ncbi:hypothetical protein GNT65_00005 [Shewanella sp. JBTF-M18]|uniref:RiboL-PSP-HEPN domain-containing protein n=1 Tax=Shewanella insulae TaxID=2681496 RepID=A0A6L7HU18_9GAMM|nr:hypothetical protein [Shewanella insulae]MXR67074.1 hypothetical protein [Shewanella insulae]
MDIEVFLKERVTFANNFYEQGCKPFKEIMELIEQEKTPYEPVYDESGEPQFIHEWLEARDGVESIGLAAVSMLSSSLQLYMNEWLNRVEKSSSPFNRKGSKGWFNALKNCMKNEGVDFSACPADLNAIEQLVLARNRTQHAEDITSNTISHRALELAKFPSPLFVDPQDQALSYNWFGQPRVYAGKHQIETISQEILDFCDWLEHEYRRIYA